MEYHQEYSDICSVEVNTFEREGIRALLNDIRTYNYENCTLVVKNIEDFGTQMSCCISSMEQFLKKRINIFIVDNTIHIYNMKKLVKLQMIIAHNEFKYNSIKGIYLAFSGSGSGLVYRGSFSTGFGLKLLLSKECANDNCLQIRRLDSMKIPWDYTSESTLSNEVEKCVDAYIKYND